MIMSKKLKLTTLLIAMACVLPSLASYKMTIPLETTQGGALPDGSINMGNGNGSGNQPTPPSTNCLYDSGTFVKMLNISNGTFGSGDRIYIYNNNLIGYYSPSNGLTPPNGLSAGKQKYNVMDTVDFELCGDNLSNYPALPPVEGPPPQPPIDKPVDPEDPDLIPECLPLDTINNYAAYDRVAGKYEYNSTTYGIDHVRVNWVYKPADYDPNRPGSYQYLREVNDTVSGPNPNYDYNAICRVRHRLE